MLNKIWLGLILIIGVTINVLTLKSGHNWGDDFAQYILNAFNIMHGRPLMQGVMIEPFIVYPPGFALILTPVVKIFGCNWYVLKFLMILFWYAAIIIIYKILVKRGYQLIATWSFSLLALSSFLFTYKQNILSDIPFFFVVCLVLFLFENNSPRNFLMTLILISLSLWIRSAGVVVFLSAIIYYLFVKREYLRSLIVIGVFVANEIVLLSVMGIHKGFLESIQHSYSNYLMSVMHEFSTIFRSLVWFFIQAQTPLTDQVFVFADKVSIVLAPLIFIGAWMAFFYKCCQQKISFLVIFSFLYFNLILFWSGFSMPPEAFTRFVLPLIPIVFIVLGKMLNSLRSRYVPVLLNIILLLVLSCNLINMRAMYYFNDDVLYAKDSQELFTWIKENTKVTDRFMFWKPRALALMTGRNSTPPWMTEEQKNNLEQRILDLKIDYLVFINKQDQSLMEGLVLNTKDEIIWKNGVYSIVKVN